MLREPPPDLQQLLGGERLEIIGNCQVAGIDAVPKSISQLEALGRAEPH